MSSPSLGTTTNEVRLHSALGYIAPQDMLEGHSFEIHQRRDERLNKVRCYRAVRRETQRATKKDSDFDASTLSKLHGIKSAFLSCLK